MRPKTERRSLPVPPPEQRIPLTLWREIRQWLLENDPDAQKLLDWSVSGVGLPANAEAMAGEIIWVILCAGRSTQAARTLERKVWAAIHSGRPAVEAFGYRAKAAAIDRAWHERHTDFAALQQIGNADPEKLLAWCKAIPFIGDDTQFQLAKNFGADLCKPDIWLCRLTGIPDQPRRSVRYRFPACMALCQPLAVGNGDRIAVVDSLLWLACNKGILKVGSDAGNVVFTKTPSTRSIF